MKKQYKSSITKITHTHTHKKRWCSLKRLRSLLLFLGFAPEKKALWKYQVTNDT